MVSASWAARWAAPGALWVLLGGALFVTGCPDDKPQATGPKADTACPKELGTKCKVLKDEWDPAKLTVEYHVLVPAETKHDEAQKYLEALYRHLMTRRDATPTQLSGYLYTNEAQFTTPPLSPVGTVVQKPSDKAPSFENKIALELWQQVEEAIHLKERGDRKLKRKLEYVAEGDKGKVLITLPFTESAAEEWAKELSFAQVMAHFTEFSLQLFNNIPELNQFVYVARWNDKDVAHIEISKADFQRLRIRDIEERIGQQSGRTFVELAEGKGSEASIEKAHQRRRAAEYKKILDQIKGQAVIASELLNK
ncbi:MAG TPA: hypothetical protein PLW65_08175 [Pseudomonadota bacterium]|nr:hypothetical protein [Pseudomonadota bacterium]